MPFIKVDGLRGLLYVPEAAADLPKKHPCEGCYTCQFCANNRCSACRGQKLHPGICTDAIKVK